MPYASKEKRREHERKRKQEDPEYVARKKEYMRQWNERNREKVRARNKAKWQREKDRLLTGTEQTKRLAASRRYYDRNREKRQADSLKYYHEHREHYQEPNKVRAKAWRKALREAVLAHYGRLCACCGSVRELQIDHIIPWGQAPSSPRGGSSLNTWLVKNDFPEGFQTLCKSCNWSKGEGSHCAAHFSILKL